MRNKNFFILIAGLAFTAALLVVWSFLPHPPKIISVDPPNQAVGVELTARVSLAFDKAIYPDQVYFAIEPETPLQKSQSSKNVIALYPERPFVPGQKYRLKAWYQNEPPIFWEFTTKVIPKIEERPFPIATPSATQSSAKERVIASLPRQSENYYIQYLPDADQFFIQILKNPYDRYQNEAVRWLASFGITDPEKELNLLFTSSRWVAPR
ncbi:hypothetical protein FJZ40_00445 [Candidatus Shapirobacteria bacterium]|nr:hypothetical protein [Candidatus Shapirobacteria bacterium]